MLTPVAASASAVVLALTSVPAPFTVAPGQVLVSIVHAGPDNSCGADNMTLVQSSSTTVPFTVPGAGVLTSWSTYANADPDPGHARLLAFVPDRVGGRFTMVGKSARGLVTPSTINTFASRVPVPARTVLGLQVSKSEMYCFSNGPELSTSDVFEYSVLFNPDTNTVMQAIGSTASAQASVSAVWEPDEDVDGFGDVTQDACPQSRLSQAPCPAPKTTIKGKPKKLSRNRTVRLRLQSDIDGTFTCAVDHRRAKACRSPFIKTFKLGKHSVAITAVSAAGISDPTPAIIKFRIVRSR